MAKITSIETFGSTPRIQRLRNQFTRARVSVSLDRAITYTKVYKDTPSEPMVLRRAKAFKAYCKAKPIHIGKDELIVASSGDRPRVAVICPEIHASWFDTESDSVSTRPQDPYHADACQ